MKNNNFKLLLSLVVLITIFFGGFFLALELRKPNEIGNVYFNSVTDTIISKKHLATLKPFETETKPQTVIIYKPEYIKVDTVIFEHDTLYVDTGSTKYIKYSSTFLTNFPGSDKLIGIKLSSTNLTLNLLSPLGLVHSKLFDINPQLFDYIYTENKLTLKPTKFYHNLTFYGRVRVKPIISFYDLGVGINYNTKGIIIETGIIGYYYYGLQKPYGITPELSIQYNLPWPRK